MRTIRLQSSDGDVFNADEQTIAKFSGTIKSLLEDCDLDEDGNALVPLLNVDSTTLRKILEWADHHKDDSVTLDYDDDDEGDEKKRKLTDDISSWDADFLNVDHGILAQLILAANYLDAKYLLALASRTVANMIKGKSPEQIRATFNLQCDFSPAEEAQIRLENDWCQEK